jgi:hypothetical protein
LALVSDPARCRSWLYEALCASPPPCQDGRAGRHPRGRGAGGEPLDGTSAPRPSPTSAPKARASSCRSPRPGLVALPPAVTADAAMRKCASAPPGVRLSHSPEYAWLTLWLIVCKCGFLPRRRLVFRTPHAVTG